MAIQITESARAKIQELMSAENLPDAYLRMGVRGGGCSGLSYVLEFARDVDPEKDKSFEINGIKVIVDKKSYIYLMDCTLDYVEQGLTGGFTFLNPAAGSSCGCGQSFNPKEK